MLYDIINELYINLIFYDKDLIMLIMFAFYLKLYYYLIRDFIICIEVILLIIKVLCLLFIGLDILIIL
jgi:hypothetical protein